MPHRHLCNLLETKTFPLTPIHSFIRSMDRERDWEFYLRSLSLSARESSSSNDPTASDPSLLQSVRKLCEICKNEKSEDLVARVYPQMNKLFQRTVASQSPSHNSSLLLLVRALLLASFHWLRRNLLLIDLDKGIRKIALAQIFKEFADPVVAAATLDFLNANKIKIISSFPTLLPEFFPLLLKLIAWNGEKLERPVLKIFPGLVSPGSFLPMFPSLVDLPILVVALEKVERSSGSLIGSSIASIQKSAAPEMLIQLMDESYTGSTIEDIGVDSEIEGSDSIDVSDSLFLDLLKDENDGLAERHWTSPGMAAALQSLIKTPLSERLRQALLMTPRLLDVRLGLSQESSVISGDAAFRKSSQARLLCFVITAIAKLATFHRELLPRARVSLAKVARSRNSDMRVWRRARDYLGLMNEPALCMSVLGPSSGHQGSPGTVNWAVGGSKMIAHVPFYILNDQEALSLVHDGYRETFFNIRRFVKSECRRRFLWGLVETPASMTGLGLIFETRLDGVTGCRCVPHIYRDNECSSDFGPKACTHDIDLAS
ncbi:hypothetical protein Scep_028738 [Stephania cephalantha]|uniref:Uncharacterized protein n=1 Tax=Stephania cephalantha TaxID=152367 RepID=A0AAP0HMD4_9MAGN